MHEIGCHSYAHASMEYESDEYLGEDIARCRRWYDENVGGEMRIYAFPNGSYQPGQIEIACQAGVEHILLVGGDFDRGGAPVHPRFGVVAGSRGEMRFRALGARQRVRV